MKKTVYAQLKNMIRVSRKTIRSYFCVNSAQDEYVRKLYTNIVYKS